MFIWLVLSSLWFSFWFGHCSSVEWCLKSGQIRLDTLSVIVSYIFFLGHILTYLIIWWLLSPLIKSLYILWLPKTDLFSPLFLFPSTACSIYIYISIEEPDTGILLLYLVFKHKDITYSLGCPSCHSQERSIMRHRGRVEEETTWEHGWWIKLSAQQNVRSVGALKATKY